MGTARLRTLQLLLLLGAWRARGGAARCRVTLVLSPQKATGAVCGNADASHDGELAALRMRVGRQEELLRALQRRAAEGGALAGEVRALREHSHGLNAHLGQLRAQLQPKAEAEPDPGRSLLRRSVCLRSARCTPRPRCAGRRRSCSRWTRSSASMRSS